MVDNSLWLSLNGKLKPSGAEVIIHLLHTNSSWLWLLCTLQMVVANIIMYIGYKQITSKKNIVSSLIIMCITKSLCENNFRQSLEIWCWNIFMQNNVDIKSIIPWFSLQQGSFAIDLSKLNSILIRNKADFLFKPVFHTFTFPFGYQLVISHCIMLHTLKTLG